MEYEIANRADIEELYALQLRAFESEAEMIGSRSVPALMETYAHSLADFDNWTVLVKRDEDGSIIGAIRYRKINDHIEIGRLMVAQEHRRQGVATDLLRDVEERTQERVFELYTCTKSWINIRLYEKLGYRTFREEAGENGLSFAYMRKTASRVCDEHEKKTCMEGEMAMELRDKNGLTEREFLAPYGVRSQRGGHSRGQKRA